MIRIDILQLNVPDFNADFSLRDFFIVFLRF